MVANALVIHQTLIYSIIQQMQHFPHPDEALFTHYAAAIAPAVYQSVFPTVSDPNILGKDIRTAVANIVAKICDELILEHRKRFPMPVEDLMAVPGVPGARFCPERRNEVLEYFKGFPIVVDDRIPTGQMQMYSPGNIQTAPKINPFFDPTETVSKAYEKTRQAFIALGKAVPQWIKDLESSIDISDFDKLSVFDAIGSMMQGQRFNVESGSIKGAFDWKTAPFNIQFWDKIAQSLPPVVDHQADQKGPAKTPPEDGQ